MVKGPGRELGRNAAANGEVIGLDNAINSRGLPQGEQIVGLLGFEASSIQDSASFQLQQENAPREPEQLTAASTAQELLDEQLHTPSPTIGHDASAEAFAGLLNKTLTPKPTAGTSSLVEEASSGQSTLPQPQLGKRKRGRAMSTTASSKRRTDPAGDMNSDTGARSSVVGKSSSTEKAPSAAGRLKRPAYIYILAKDKHSRPASARPDIYDVQDSPEKHYPSERLSHLEAKAGGSKVKANAKQLQGDTMEGSPGGVIEDVVGENGQSGTANEERIVTRVTGNEQKAGGRSGKVKKSNRSSKYDCIVKADAPTKNASKSSSGNKSKQAKDPETAEMEAANTSKKRQLRSGAARSSSSRATQSKVDSNRNMAPDEVEQLPPDEQDAEDEDEAEVPASGDQPSEEVTSAIGELLGQRDLFNKIIEASKRVGIQQVKEKEVHHSLKIKTCRVKNFVKLIKQATAQHEKLANMSSEPSQEREALLDGIEETLETVQSHVADIREDKAGEKKKEMIEDIYAFGLPTCIMLLRSAFSCHACTDPIETPSLIVLLKFTGLIMKFGDTANSWVVRPDPNLTIVKPIRNSVLPRLRLMQRAFIDEYRRRMTEEKREHQERLVEENSRTAEEEEDRGAAEQNRMIRERRREISEDLAKKMKLYDYRARYAQRFPNASQSHNQRNTTDARDIEDAEVEEEGYVSINSLDNPIDRVNIFGRRDGDRGASHTTPDEESVEHGSRKLGNIAGWEELEMAALIDGLMEFSGSNRYHLLLNSYGKIGQPLQFRNFDEVVKKAKELKISLESIVDQHPEKGPLAQWTLEI
ncbi:MAG: hypothetical protein M1827_007643 [Pycnora praestabilis]|nr:MAG: hypothetical protein M1827_007643 [Pycnora praestabilis]